MKRTLFILGALLIVAAVVFLGYWFRYRGGGLGPLGGEDATGALPTPEFGSGTSVGDSAMGGGTALTKPIADLATNKEKLALVADIPTATYFVDTQNNVTVVSPDGTISRISRGQKTTLNTNKIQNLMSASFSPDGTKILAIFGTRLNPQASIFDVALKSWQPLVESFASASWSPASKQLAYVAVVDGISSLKIIDTSGTATKSQELLRLHAEDLVIDWVAPQDIFVTGRSSAVAPVSAFFYNIVTRTITPTLEDQFGVVARWDRSGIGLLLGSGSSGRTGNLRVIGKNGATLKNFTLLTIPSKCAFLAPPTGTSTQTVPDPTYLVCGVPRDVKILTSSVIPDDYLQKEIYTSDDFYKIDVASGNIDDVLAGIEKQFDADDLRTFNNRVFFVNRYDQKLYTVSL